MAFEMIDLYRLYQCESGDIKKTDNIDKGSILDETDTGFQYKFNGITWVYSPQPVSDVRIHEIINNESNNESDTGVSDINKNGYTRMVIQE